MSTDALNWGINLWDQTSNILKFQDTGYAIHERLYKFLVDFAKLQSESFQNQKKLCEKYVIDIKKAVGLENTYATAFNEFIYVFKKLVDTENLIVDTFEFQAQTDLKMNLDEHKRKIKRWKQDRERFTNEMKGQIRIIEDEIRRYKDKYRDMMRAKEDFEKTDNDQTNSRLDVEKAYNYYQVKLVDFERSKQDYSIALQQFNMYRKSYYSYTLPTWGNLGYQINKDRMDKTITLINSISDRFGVFFERLQVVHEDLQSVTNIPSCEKDTQMLIDFLKTGRTPPPDLPFRDITQIAGEQTSLGEGGSLASGRSSNQENVFGLKLDNIIPKFIPQFDLQMERITVSNGCLDENRPPSLNGNILQSQSTVQFDETPGYASVYSALTNFSDKAVRKLSLGSNIGPTMMPPGPQVLTNHQGNTFFKKLFTRRSRQDLSQSDAGGDDDIYSFNRRRSNPFSETAAVLRRSRRKASHRWRSITRNMKIARSHHSREKDGVRPALSAGNINTNDLDVRAEAEINQSDLGDADYNDQIPDKTFALSNKLDGQSNYNDLDISDFSDTSSKLSGEDSVKPLTIDHSDENQEPLPPPPPVDSVSDLPSPKEFPEVSHESSTSYRQQLDIKPATTLSLNETSSSNRIIKRFVSRWPPEVPADASGDLNVGSLQTEIEALFAQKRKELNNSSLFYSKENQHLPKETHEVPRSSNLDSNNRKSISENAQLFSSGQQYASIPVGQFNPKYLSQYSSDQTGKTSVKISPLHQPKGGFMLPQPINKKAPIAAADSYPELKSNYDNASSSIKNLNDYNFRNSSSSKSQSSSPSYVTALSSTAGELVVGECIAKYEYQSESLPVCYWSFRQGDKFLLMQSPKDEADGWYRVHRLPLTLAAAQVNLNSLTNANEPIILGFVPVAYMAIKKYPQPIDLHSWLTGFVKASENKSDNNDQPNTKKSSRLQMGSPVARKIHNPPPTSSKNGYRSYTSNFSTESRYDTDI